MTLLRNYMSMEMKPVMPPTGEPSSEILRRAVEGDSAALAEAFLAQRPRLRRLVQFRLDRRLLGRIDPSDVLQEAYLEVARSLEAYLESPQVSFYLWLRFITGRKLQAIHRHHLGTRARDAGRESPQQGEMPQACSVTLAEQCAGRSASPSEAAQQAELRLRVQQALDTMDPIDREILVLRHFEELTNAEAAHVLSIGESAASHRFIRALRRLKVILAGSDYDPQTATEDRPP